MNLLHSRRRFGATGDAALALVADDKCITDYDPETLTRWGSLLSFQGPEPQMEGAQENYL